MIITTIRNTFVKKMIEINREDMSYQKKEKKSIHHTKLCRRTKTKEGTIFLNVNNLPGKSCRRN